MGYGNANYAPGANAVTTTTADFVQPAVGGTVLAAVADNRFVALNQTLYVGGPTLGGTAGGYYTAGTLTGTTGVWLTNTGYIGNASAGATILHPSTVSPGGVEGPTGASSTVPGPTGGTGATGASGINAYTTTTANFVMPAASGGTVLVPVAQAGWIAAGQQLFVGAGATSGGTVGGYLQALTTTGSTGVWLQTTACSVTLLPE